MTPRQLAYANKQRENKVRDDLLRSYIFARVYRGWSHDHAVKELKPL